MAQVVPIEVSAVFEYRSAVGGWIGVCRDVVLAIGANIGVLIFGDTTLDVSRGVTVFFEALLERVSALEDELPSPDDCRRDYADCYL